MGLNDLRKPMSKQEFDGLGKVELINAGKEVLQLKKIEVEENAKEDKQKRPLHQVRVSVMVDPEYGGGSGTPKKRPATIYFDIPDTAVQEKDSKAKTRAAIAMSQLKDLLVAFCGGNPRKKGELGKYPTTKDEQGNLVGVNPIVVAMDYGKNLAGARAIVAVEQTDGKYEKDGKVIQGTPANKFNNWEPFKAS